MTSYTLTSASILSARRLALAAGAVLCVFATTSLPAYALSEIKREELPAPAPGPDDQSVPENAVPMPDPIAPPPSSDEPADPSAPDEEEPEQVEPEEPGAGTMPDLDPNAPLPEVVYDLSRLPEPVRRMHGLLVEAAKTGDIEKLRPLIGTGDSAPQLSFGDIGGDPIEFLRGLSGDTEGQEILAIIEEILDAGYVHLGEGTSDDLYVWPYFFGIPLDRLDARQRVELFKIVTAGDYEDMKTFGSYIFYRLGITPEGRWAFFVAGD
ncbi:hypothetical protein [Oryzicola mucosus]|uniref:hypothetical protein n=1 Tax=Oryzicola mucosus TaxID=2767425 RepID=UPI0038B342ED